MKLQQDPYLGSLRDFPSLVRQLTTLWGQLVTQVNLLSEGYIQAATNAATSAPTAGDYRQGDTVRNLAPIEAGSPGSAYVITGWICVADGNPGTWVECRSLTGN